MAARGKYDKENIAMLIAKLWGGITDDQFDLLKEHLEIKKYKKNEIIYKNEGTPEYALCLIAGKVKIYKEGIGGKSQIIRVIKPIEFFGFRAYFADEIYKTAAMSLENCVVAQFPLAVLMKLLSKSFNIGFFFIKYLSVEIGKSGRPYREPHPETYPCPTCRGTDISERLLWVRKRRKNS